jgi:glycosyltransferase involved in cell wall biosynthesis
MELGGFVKVTKKPKISVIIPVYNGNRTIAQAIKSILNQTFEDFELILIDDCSKDSSSQIIKTYSKNDQRIKFIQNKKNIGLAESLNIAINVSVCNFIARLDQDDEALPERLIKQYKFMQKHPDVAVAGSAVLIMGKTKKFDKIFTVPTDFNEIKKTLLNYNCIFHPSVIMRKKSIINAGGYRKEFKNAEDYDLWLRISKKEKIVNIQDPLTRYNYSTGGMTLGRKWEQLFYTFLAQESYKYPNLPFNKIRKMAYQKLTLVDRKNFFLAFLDGTIKDLSGTKQFWSATKLILIISIKELGVVNSIKFFKKIYSIK